MALLKEMKRIWAGFDFRVHLFFAHGEVMIPSIRSLHILWPWAKDVLAVLAPSLFCDATFHLTVYNYKVVAITTLDGNRHHRPLMTSFVSTSTGESWKEIFDQYDVWLGHVGPQEGRRLHTVIKLCAFLAQATSYMSSTLRSVPYFTPAE